jgi:hypothetical protein
MTWSLIKDNIIQGQWTDEIVIKIAEQMTRQNAIELSLEFMPDPIRVKLKEIVGTASCHKFSWSGSLQPSTVVDVIQT